MRLFCEAIQVARHVLFHRDARLGVRMRRASRGCLACREESRRELFKLCSELRESFAGLKKGREEYRKATGKEPYGLLNLGDES